MSKSSRRARFLRDHPICCFCGGATPAETIDHIPSAQMFWGKARPKGLESPACEPCNHASARVEQEMALLARTYPDPVTDEQQDEYLAIAQAVWNNNPALVLELQPREAMALGDSGDPIEDIAGVFTVSGPQVTRALQRFGVKLCLALEYHEKDRIIHEGGGVAVRWFSNEEVMKGFVPDHLLPYFQRPKTLRQGSFSVEDQFWYQSVPCDPLPVSIYCAGFRSCWIMIGFVFQDASTAPEVEGMTICRPGFWTERD